MEVVSRQTLNEQKFGGSTIGEQSLIGWALVDMNCGQKAACFAPVWAFPAHG
jgi:hypothetical protein